RRSRASEDQDESEAEDRDGRAGERARSGSEAAPDSAAHRAAQCSKGRRGPFPTWAQSETPAKPNLKLPRHILYSTQPGPYAKVRFPLLPARSGPISKARSGSPWRVLSLPFPDGRS